MLILLSSIIYKQTIKFLIESNIEYLIKFIQNQTAVAVPSSSGSTVHAEHDVSSSRMRYLMGFDKFQLF